YVPVTSDIDQIVLLNAIGHGLVYVNGEPRAGDPYSNGIVRVPVALRAGKNDLLFRGGRGGLQIAFRTVESPLTIDVADATRPDLIEGAAGEVWGAAVVINASRDWIKDAAITAGEEGGKQVTTPVPPIAPLSVHKAPFAFEVAAKVAGAEVRILLKVARP